MVRRVETQPCQKQYPWCRDSQSGGISQKSKIPEEWGLCPTSGTPTLETCIREMSPQNICNSMRQMSRKTIELENRESTRKGIEWTSPGTQKKEFEKESEGVNEIHLLILKLCKKGKSRLGFPPSYHFCHSLSTLLVPVGVPHLWMSLLWPPPKPAGWVPYLHMLLHHGPFKDWLW